jgi:hypothetical protein
MISSFILEKQRCLLKIKKVNALSQDVDKTSGLIAGKLCGIKKNAFYVMTTYYLLS